MSCFMTGDPDKEYRTNKPPPTRRVRERSKGDTTCPSTSQNPSRQHPSWLSDACTTRKDPESERLAKDNPETNPITIKPETASHMAELFSWVPSPYCSPPRFPFPIKSLALSAHVSPLTIHFRQTRAQFRALERGPPSYKKSISTAILNYQLFKKQSRQSIKQPCGHVLQMFILFVEIHLTVHKHMGLFERRNSLSVLAQRFQPVTHSFLIFLSNCPIPSLKTVWCSPKPLNRNY